MIYRFYNRSRLAISAALAKSYPPSPRSPMLLRGSGSMDANPDNTDAVVAWLRHLSGLFVTPDILCFFGDPYKRDGQILCSELADAIERGDHLAAIRKEPASS
jgi:hypothetical protein